MALLEFIGRLHLLLLHLPIGILAIAFLMEVLGRKDKFKYLLPAVGFALGIGMFSAIFAAASGYVLSLEGGYNEVMLWRHKWLGIGTAAISVLIFWLHQNKNSGIGQKIYLPVFMVLMILIGWTGHLGGSMTHGEEFLIEPFTTDRSIQTTVFNIDSALVYDDLVKPIFEEKCVSCHNDSKSKGELLMNSMGGIKKGGESGAFLVAGAMANSLFLKRIALPLQDKEHMPPKGKQQLSNEEVTLLEWWVTQGAHFDKHVGELDISEDVQKIFDMRSVKNNSVFALDIASASESELNRLANLGYSIKQLEQSKPFLSASFSNSKALNENTIVALESISEQLVDLDLSNSNLADPIVPSFSEYPHLRKLFLQNTQLTGKGFDELESLKYLEVINLYNTPIEKEALSSLGKIKSLKRLFLWQTNLSESAIDQFKKQRKDVLVNTGLEQNIFGKSILSPPVILADKDIFKDSIKIEFEINLSEVDLYYTLDGSIPDSTSIKYVAPFYLHRTAQIQVVGQKENWETSGVAEKTVVRSRYNIGKVKLNQAPNDKYKAEGAESLVNHKKGTTTFSDGEWLGYQNSNVIVTLDMETSMDLSGVTIGALEATSSYIFFPKQLEVLLSDDGSNYHSVASKIIPTTQKPEEPSVKNFFLDFDIQKGRFIKVVVKSNLVNPDWHPAPGEPCWVFIDEIMVE